MNIQIPKKDFPFIPKEEKSFFKNFKKPINRRVLSDNKYIADSLVEYLPKRINNKSGKKLYGFIVEMNEGDGMSWLAEHLNQKIKNSSSSLKYERYCLTSGQGGNPLPNIIDLIGEKRFLKILSELKIIDGISTLPFKINWITIFVLGVPTFFIGNLFSDGEATILYRIITAFIGSLMMVFTIWAEKKATGQVNRGAGKLSLDIVEKLEYLSEKQFAILSEKIASTLNHRSLFPRVLIIDNFTLLDSISKSVLLTFLEKESRKLERKDVWIVFDYSIGDNFRKRIDNHIGDVDFPEFDNYQIDYISEFEKKELIRKNNFPSERIRFQSIKYICRKGGIDAIKRILNMLEREVQYYELNDLHKYPHRNYIRFLQLLSQTSYPYSLSFREKFLRKWMSGKKERNLILMKFFGAEERLVDGDIKFLIGQFKNRIPEGIISADIKGVFEFKIKEEVKDFFVQLNRDFPFRNLNSQANVDKVIQSLGNEGLGHLFWAIFWYDYLGGNVLQTTKRPIEGGWIAKLSFHLFHLNFGGIQTSDRDIFLPRISRVYEYTLNGCIRTCSFTTLTSYLGSEGNGRTRITFLGLVEKYYNVLDEIEFKQSDGFFIRFYNLLWKAYILTSNPQIIELLNKFYFQFIQERYLFNLESEEKYFQISNIQLYLESLPIDEEFRSFAIEDSLRSVPKFNLEGIRTWNSTQGEWMRSIILSQENSFSDLKKIQLQILPGNIDNFQPYGDNLDIEGIFKSSDTSLHIANISFAIWSEFTKMSFDESLFLGFSRSHETQKNIYSKLKVNYSSITNLVHKIVCYYYESIQQENYLKGHDFLVDAVIREFSISSIFILYCLMESLKKFPKTIIKEFKDEDEVILTEKVKEIIYLSNKCGLISEIPFWNRRVNNSQKTVNLIFDNFFMAIYIHNRFGIKSLEKLTRAKRYQAYIFWEKRKYLINKIDNNIDLTTNKEVINFTENLENEPSIINQLVAIPTYYSSFELVGNQWLNSINTVSGNKYGATLKSILSLPLLTRYHALPFLLEEPTSNLFNRNDLDKKTFVSEIFSFFDPKNYDSYYLALDNIISKIGSNEKLKNKIISLMEDKILYMEMMIEKNKFDQDLIYSFKNSKAIFDVRNLTEEFAENRIQSVSKLFEEWQDRKELWLYPVVSKYVLHTAFRLGELEKLKSFYLPDAISLLDRDPREDQFNTYFNLAKSVLSFFWEFLNPQQIEIVYNYLEKSVNKWENLSSTEENFLLFDLLLRYTTDTESVSKYKIKQEYWGAKKTEIFLSSKSLRIASSDLPNKWFVLFKQFCFEFERFELPRNINPSLMEAMKGDKIERKKYFLEKLQLKNPIPAPIIGGRLNYEFLAFGDLLFKGELGDEDDFSFLKEEFNSKAKIYFPELVGMIGNSTKIPPSIRLTLEKYSSRLVNLTIN